MAVVVSAVVGFVGAAAGAAIGTAVFGTAVLGTVAGVAITAGFIGGVIGAGIAGGLLSMARGGDFGKGFLIGAGGAAIGGFLAGAFDGATGAAASTGEATAAGVEGGVAGSTAPVLDGVTSSAATGAEAAAVSEIGTAATTGGTEAALNGTMSSVPAAEGAFNLESLGATGGMSSVPAGVEGGFSLDALGANAGGQAAGSMLGPQATIPGVDVPNTEGGFTGGEPSSLNNADLNNAIYGDEGGLGPSGLESINTAQAAPESWTPDQSSMTYEKPFSLGDLVPEMSKSDYAKLAMGTVDSAMKYREAGKLNKLVNANKPMTFEQFKTQYSDPNAYRYAAENMARAGRTGGLPVLLARMNNNIRGKYQDYISGANQQFLQNKAGIAGARSGALTNLFSGYASNQAAAAGRT